MEEKTLIFEETEEIKKVFALYDTFFAEVQKFAKHLAREGLTLGKDLFCDYMARGVTAISDAFAFKQCEDLSRAKINATLLNESTQAEAKRKSQKFENYRLRIEGPLYKLHISPRQVEFRGFHPYLTDKQKAEITEKFTYNLETDRDKDLYDQIQHFCETFNAFADYCEAEGYPGLSENIISSLTENNKVPDEGGPVLRADSFLIGDFDKSGEQNRLKVNHRFFKSR